MIYNEIPKDFSPKFQVVSCYIECGGKLLLLHRSAHKPQGGKWGAPAGKIDDGETADEALVRETREETGLKIDSSQLHFLKKIAVRHSDWDFMYHMYRVELSEIPEIKINPIEHQDYRWVTPQNALTLDLVADMAECIQMYY